MILDGLWSRNEVQVGCDLRNTCRKVHSVDPGQLSASFALKSNSVYFMNQYFSKHTYSVARVEK